MVGQNKNYKNDYSFNCLGITLSFPRPLIHSLHLVQTKEASKLMLSVSEKLSDKGFFRKLNSISSAANAIANDVMYYNFCWADVKKQPLNLNDQ